MSHLVDALFALRGRFPARPGPQCPDDETLAGFVEALLPAGQRRQVEDHLLVCAACHGTLSAVLEAGPASPAPSPFAVVVRLLDRGLELLRPAARLVDGLLAGAPAPALGAVRGEDGDPQDELIAIEGPGLGLDVLRLQLQPDGLVRLAVQGNAPPVLPGEISSVLLEVDGSPREKRPYNGQPLTFAPLDRGRYKVRLLARAPGREARELTAAAVELH